MRELDWSELRTWTRGRLPHWELPGMSVFVTFRLAGSLPNRVKEAYRIERRILERRIAAEPNNPELRRERTRLYCSHIDRCLDSGVGPCHLRDPWIAERVMATLLHGDGGRYVIEAAVVMPNHVHLVATLDEESHLSEVTHSWKSYTAHLAVKRLGVRPPFWQDESYDHVVRDEAELAAFVRYTVENPAKGGLEDWPWVYRRASPKAIFEGG